MSSDYSMGDNRLQKSDRKTHVHSSDGLLWVILSNPSSFPSASLQPGPREDTRTQETHKTLLVLANGLSLFYTLSSQSARDLRTQYSH